MRKDIEAAWKRLLARIEEAGATLLEDSWKGARTRHRIRCAAGHEVSVAPNNLDAGQELCKHCAGTDRTGAWDNFRAVVQSAGGEVLEGAWKGSQQFYRVRCAAGHESEAMPNKVQQGGPLCRDCSSTLPEFAWKRFVDAVERCGGAVLEGAWKGAHSQHAVRCKAGHESTVSPTQVAMGCGFCGPCRGQVFDVFYVVAGSGMVKFGITSGDPKDRLGKHKRDGLDRQLFLRTGLPDGHARNVELTLIHTLQRMGFQPARGREYFPSSCLNTILNLARTALPDATG